MAKIFTAEEFDREALSAEVAFVDFYADWCGPCQGMAPIIDRLSEKFEGRAVVGKVNVDASPEVARRYRVMSIPSMFIFKKGEIVRSFIGFTDEATLEAAIEAALK